MKYLLLLPLLASPVEAATSNEIDDLLTTDVLGYTCIQEEDLDAAFFNGGKGAMVPQTCITEAAPPKDCAILEPLLGRAATSGDCATFTYRWFKTFDPDRVLFVPVDPITPVVEVAAAVPVPAAWVLMISALFGLAYLKRPT